MISGIALTNLQFLLDWIDGVNATKYFEQCENMASNDWDVLETYVPPTATNRSEVATNALPESGGFFRIC